MRTPAATIALVALAAMPALADFQLDSRYTDNDGDLIADIPANSSQWANPNTLIFAYTPVEDPSIYAEVWQPFLDHMAEVTGKRVQFFPVQSNAAQIETMRAGRLHIAGFNAGSNPLAVACAGFRPFAMMASEDGSFGYEMELITYPTSGISSIEDIRARTLAFTVETSNSGFKAPQALLEAEYGLVANRDYKPAFSGAHDNSILGVVNRDYDAAAIANSVARRMMLRGVIKEGDYTTIYKSDSFPTTSYGTAHNLHPELQDKIREAFFSFDWTGTSMEAEFGSSGESQFIPVTFKEHWSVIRQIDAAMGVQYTCN